MKKATMKKPSPSVAREAKSRVPAGQAKVDATSAAVAEIVAQRTTMRDGMMKMQMGMMSHMMEHIQAAGTSVAVRPSQM